jgi:hypothetical protein
LSGYFFREARTVNELAEALAQTDNAGRAALTALERGRPSSTKAHGVGAGTSHRVDSPLPTPLYDTPVHLL